MVPTIASTMPTQVSQVAPGESSGMAAWITNNPISRWITGNSPEKSTDSIATQGVSQIAGGPLDPSTINGQASNQNDSAKRAAGLYISMAELNSTAGNVVEARRFYHRALLNESDNLTALLGLARLEDREGNMDEAITIYRQALAAHPEDTAVLNDLALCYARKGDLRSSLQMLEGAVRYQPDKLLYRNNIAKVLTELNQIEDALSHLTAVHEPAVAHYNMGVLLNSRGRTQEAIHTLDMATKIDPAMPQARQLLAQLRSQKTQSISGPSSPATELATKSREASGQHSSTVAENGTRYPKENEGILPTPYRPAQTSQVDGSWGNTASYPATGVPPMVVIPTAIPQPLPATTVRLPVENTPQLLPQVR
jgi:tetratricopeptide (TPR) repeat protein